MSTHDLIKADTVIIGGGPTGLSSAIQLKKLGVERVLLIEREPELGGIPRHCHHFGFGWSDLRRMMTGPQYAKKKIQLLSNYGVHVWKEATVTSFQSSQTLSITSPKGLSHIHWKSVLLATGCRERPRSARLVPGDRPYGIMTTGQLQQLIHLKKMSPGKRAVIVGAEHVSFSAVHTLVKAGAQIAAMVTEHPKHQTFPIFRMASGLRKSPILCRARVARICGRSKLEGVEIAFNNSSKTTFIECDLLVFTGDWIPDHELARRGSVAINPNTLGPEIDHCFRTSVKGIFAAGNVIHGAIRADLAALEGEKAAHLIHDYLKSKQWVTHFAPIEVKPPILWVSPTRVAFDDTRNAVKEFIFCVSQFRGPSVIHFRQNGKILYSKKFLSLTPNQPRSIRGDWTNQISNEAPISLGA